jgi:hypothetical protein
MRNELIASQILTDQEIILSTSSENGYGTQNTIAITFYNFNGNIKLYGSLDKENWFDFIQDNKKIEYIGYENNITSKTIFFLINTIIPWIKIKIEYRAGQVIASEQRVQGKIDSIRITRA